MVYIVRPIDYNNLVIYVCSKDSPEKMMSELANIELEYIMSDESVIAKKNDPFLFSLIHDN
jgi:hypothetical protein